MRWIGILVPLIVVVCLGGARAAGMLEARVNAVAYAPMEVQRQVEVTLFDDSNDNKTLKTLIEARLSAAGYTLAKNAPLTISFEHSDTVGDGKPEDSASLLELTGKSGTDRKDDYAAHLKLFTTKTNDEGSPGAAYGGSVRL